MISGAEIRALAALFSARRVGLWHACQWIDLLSYLRIGGVPSRRRLEESNSSFTPFETDARDKENQVWDKVFFNLEDFGSAFANGARAVPNPYGPIVLDIRPEAILGATDVALCLRSAAAKGFDRAKEALSSIRLIDALFAYPREHPEPIARRRLKSREQLQVDHPGAGSAELSCSVTDGFVSFSYLYGIYVDPYRFPDATLCEHVLKVTKSLSLTHVYERRCRNASRDALFNEIANIVVNRTPTLAELCLGPSGSNDLKNWAAGLTENNLGYRFLRFGD